MVHGTFSEYNHHRCRCSDCRAAARAYARQARQKRLAGGVPAGLHGTENAYTNYGCRCDDCREAGTDRYLAERTGRPRRRPDEIRQAVAERRAAAKQIKEQHLRQEMEWQATSASRRAAFEELVAPLDGRARQILELRFGIDGGMPRTLQQVRAYVNLSRERIRQIEQHALAQLRRAHPGD